MVAQANEVESKDRHESATPSDLPPLDTLLMIEALLSEVHANLLAANMRLVARQAAERMLRRCAVADGQSPTGNSHGEPR